MTKYAWIDVRAVTIPQAAVIEASIHSGVDAIVSDDLDLLATLPPTVKRVAIVSQQNCDAGIADAADVILITDAESTIDAIVHRASLGNHADIGAWVNVVDGTTLRAACVAAARLRWTAVQFRDVTKIPLELVLATAENSKGSIVTVVHNLEEARIVFGVLEKGSDAVLLRPHSIEDVSNLVDLCRPVTASTPLEAMQIRQITHVDVGERVCIDTCTYFDKDEGMLVGSYSHSMLLACSETHPLPYMPTRPFRVNAGAVHSYVLCPDNRTHYLTDLGSGSEVLAVSATGQTRKIIVGRIKIERRPLLSIDALSASGVTVNLIVQDDWHVRVLGPEARVLNVTELRPHDQVLGYLVTDKRHVGLPIKEFCIEK